MAESLKSLEELFLDLVIAAIPQSTSAQTHWHDGRLCIHVLRSDGAFSQHTIKICIMEEAIDNYARSSEEKRLDANTRLAGYISHEFSVFYREGQAGKTRSQSITEWVITSKVLNG